MRSFLRWFCGAFLVAHSMWGDNALTISTPVRTVPAQSRLARQYASCER